jgi:histidinol phosphatase-like PHP family hydrolase
MKNEGKKFFINVDFNGKDQKLEIIELETTDGAPYYQANLNEENISQLRKEDKTWEQLWGNIDIKTINAIGAEIEKHLPK